MRINYFEQVKAFYSFVFNTDLDVRPTHHSLYHFLLNQNNRNNWVEWFKCPFDLAMEGCGVNSKTTYYKILGDLKEFGLIDYRKGINLNKAPQIKIIVLSTVPNNGTLTVPLSEPLSVPLSGNLTEQLTVLLSGNLSGNNIRLLTNNFKLIDQRLSYWIDSEINPKPKTELALKPKKEIPSLIEFMSYCQTIKEIDFNAYKFGLQSKYESWVDNKWKDGHNKPIKNWKTKIKNTIPFIKPINNGTQKPSSNKPTMAERIAAAAERLANKSNLINGDSEFQDFTEDIGYADV